MKTMQYNPSPLEVKIATALSDLAPELQTAIGDHEILDVENKMEEDNPLVRFYLLDTDGDPHEVVLKVIQTPDKF